MLQVFFEDLTSLNCCCQVHFALLQNPLQLANYPAHRSLLIETNQTEIITITTIIVMDKNKTHKVKIFAFSNIKKSRKLMDN